MLHPDWNPLCQGPRDHGAVTVLGAGFQAEEAGPSPGQYQVFEGHQVIPGGERLQVVGIDPPELIVPAAPRRGSAVGRRPQASQVEILDASRSEIGRQGGLCEAGPA